MDKHFEPPAYMTPDPTHCAFCGMSVEKVAWVLKAQLGIGICDQCIDVATASLAEWRAEHPGA